MTVKIDTVLKEQTGLSKDAKQQISEAWKEQLSEAREQLTATLREEFAQKFEHDKSILVESMDKFLTDKIHIEMAEFAEDKKALATDRVKYKKQIKEHTKILDTFITRKLVHEVKELHEDRRNTRTKVKKMEGFLLEQLSQEIREFHDDKRELSKQRVKMIREGKRQLIETKQKFIKKAAKIIESKINNVLTEEITQYRQDIIAARENDFGRRLFEAFAGEYMTSYLNESSEVSKLQAVLKQKDIELTDVKVTAIKQKKLTESVQTKLNATEDRFSRNKLLNDLLTPLNKEKKGVMGELLESVKTDKLRDSFNKYLPSVLNESVPRLKKKETLRESVKRTSTGNRKTVPEIEDFNKDLEKIKILAGIQ